MRPIIFVILAAFVALALTAAADAAPGEHGRTGPAVTNTFRVIADNSYNGTGVAISTQGYILTTLSIVSHCDGRERCSLGVTDDTEHPTWRPATIAAIDRSTGIVVLRTGPLPTAAMLSTRPARRDEPIHAYGYGHSGGSHFQAAHVVTPDLVVQFREEQPRRRAVVTNLVCNEGDTGSGGFALRDEALLGILVGEVDDPNGPPGTALVSSASIRAFLDANSIPYARPAPPRRHARR